MKKYIAAWCLLSGVLVHGVVHAQVDSTKAVKTAPAIAQQPKVQASPVNPADLTFPGFLKAYAGFNRTTDVTLPEYLFWDKKAYDYFSGGVVRMAVEITPSNFCVTATALKYGVVRKGCVDGYLNTYTAFRNYGAQHPVENNTVLVDVLTPPAKKGKFGLVPPALYDSFETVKADFDGVVIFVPRHTAATALYFDETRGVCFRFTRQAFTMGQAVLAFECGGV